MPRIAFLAPRRGMRPAFLDLAPEGVLADVVHETALAASDPGRWMALLAPMHIDQWLFAEAAHWIEAFLGAGGTLVFNGLLACPFHPALARFEPIARPRVADLVISWLADHPIYAGVDPSDLSFRRGVAGFYGRGANPPPGGARVLATLGPARVPVDWLWHPPGGGRLLMHAGNDLWMYAGGPTTAARLTPQVLRWAVTPFESEERGDGGKTPGGRAGRRDLLSSLRAQ